MSENLLPENQTSLLLLFQKAKEGRLSAGDLKTRLTRLSKSSSTDLSASQAEMAMEALISQGLIAASGGSKDLPHPRPNASYRLTEKGRHQLRPAKPELSDELLEAQQAYVLLQVFRSREQKLSRADLNGKLKTRAAVGQLEFDVKASPETIAYHLHQLVDKGVLIEERRGNSVVYSLEPETGPAALAGCRQHEAVSFTMTGATLNALLASARGGIDTKPAKVEETTQEEGHTDSPAGRELSSDDVEETIRELRQGAFASKDLIPIHEVRRLIADRHGAAGADHATLDPILLEMRSNGAIELMAISDTRRTNAEHLEDSIPGINETIFYIVNE